PGTDRRIYRMSRSAGKSRPIVGIVMQARMNSERLPGKVLLPLAGRPMLYYLLERMKSVKNADRIIVATTTDSKDDELVEFCERQKVAVFRGNEMDVLDRFHQACSNYGLDHVVRVTSDNPLTCENHLSDLIAMHLSDGCDISHHSGLPLGVGVGMVSFQALDCAHRESCLMHHREHVTLYLLEPGVRERFHIGVMAAVPPCNRPELRLTVDTPEDLLMMDTLHQELYNGSNIPLEQAIFYLDRHPEIRQINALVRQRNPREGQHGP
ncbi:MAG: glycosyltransferase family protein, partial [Candidatus Wallbacteria bacterium]|nr:glycosyltransferase family protein [Candidatus Wallbacteria bacterium]